jgi:cytochrome c oxidase assembly factor CtaG
MARVALLMTLAAAMLVLAVGRWTVQGLRWFVLGKADPA